MSTSQLLQAKSYLEKWNQSLKDNFFEADSAFAQSVKFAIKQDPQTFLQQLESLGEVLAKSTEDQVNENNERLNLPQSCLYNNVGTNTNEIKHHPLYSLIGDVIYGTGMMKHFATAGEMTKTLLKFFLTSHLGEAGHNCPVACTAGIIRVLQAIGDIPEKNHFLEKLCQPSFEQNFTGAQFITELQGGSDVGQNCCMATKNEHGKWFINGEKWFCSNANAELMLVSARYDKESNGTKGLGLFLIKRWLDSGSANGIHIKRLKEKLGTRSMASAEIDFINAEAIAMGAPEKGFKLLMQNVLHISRIFNSFATIGAAHRAFQIARNYARYRQAFGQRIINYPLIKQSLADILSENSAMLAASVKTTLLQDVIDLQPSVSQEQSLLLRFRANINKYFTAKLSVHHIHACIDILGGNGAIESFSPLPRLLRDAIVYENWEGTHNTLRMQILRDQHRYQIIDIFISDLKQQLAGHQHEFARLLFEQLDKIRIKYQSLLKCGPEQQSLMIRDYIHTLAQLDACTQLLNEATNGLNGEVHFDKMALLKWLLIKYQWLQIEPYSEEWFQVLESIKDISIQ